MMHFEPLRAESDTSEFKVVCIGYSTEPEP